MANVLRGPLVINERGRPPVLAVVAFVLPSLLGTLLLPPAAPTANAAFLPAISRPPYLNADTSQGTPKPLRADAQAPVFNAPQHRIERVWPVVDTSQDTPVGLFPIPVTPLPPGQIGYVAAPRLLWQPADTTQDSPKGLIPDAQAPVFNAPQFLVVPQPPVVDTSQSSFGTTKVVVVVPLPPGSFSSAVPAMFWYQPADSSQETNPQLFPPAVVPPVVVGGSNFGGGLGGSGGGARLKKAIDDLDFFKELEQKVAAGKPLAKALRELNQGIEEVTAAPAAEAAAELAPAAEGGVPQQEELTKILLRIEAKIDALQKAREDDGDSESELLLFLSGVL